MKKVHKLVSLGGIWDEGHPLMACGLMDANRGSPLLRFTTEETGVTCKNCLRTIKHQEVDHG